MISDKKNLRTGAPVWVEYKRPLIPTNTFTDNLSCDIAIIGAGITGAMVAEALSGHGFDIAIFDRREPLSGSTAASTALLQYEIDKPLTKLISKMGKDKAIAAWRRSRLAVESLAAKISELDIDCNYERRDSLYLPGNVLDGPHLQKEGELRNAIGLPCSYLNAKEIADCFGIHAKGALMSRNNLACNPVQLAAGFLNAAIDRGATVYSPVTIEDVEQQKNGFRLKTANGKTVKAKYIIYATGYEIPKAVQSKRHKIFSTYAISTKKIRGLMPSLPLIWEASDPYIYARSTQDGRIIFGGEDEEFSDADARDALIPKKTKILERKLRRLLPDHDFELEHQWAGSFGASTRGLPSIGVIPGQKSAYAILAYGGNGITFSRMAAEIISGEILGWKDPDADLFAFPK